MIRVAAFQSRPLDSFKDRKNQIFNALQYSDKHDIDFLCFPEGFLTGYYEDKYEAIKNSFDISDVVFQAWLTELSSFRATFVIGFNEIHKGELFNSAAVVENGQLIGIQRKHYLYYNYFPPALILKSSKAKELHLELLFVWIVIIFNHLESYHCKEPAFYLFQCATK